MLLTDNVGHFDLEHTLCDWMQGFFPQAAKADRMLTKEPIRQLDFGDADRASDIDRLSGDGMWCVSITLWEAHYLMALDQTRQ
jgi:hypothetical protein